MNINTTICGHCLGENGPTVGIAKRRKITFDRLTGLQVDRPFYGEIAICQKCWDLYSKTQGEEHVLERFGGGIERKNKNV